MNQWNPAPGLLACACLLIGVTTPASAFDSAAYNGVWTNQNPALTLKIDADHADIAIDGKTQPKVMLQYLQSQLPTAPFLYVDASDEPGKQDHRFFLMVNADEQDQPRLNGYYERVTLGTNGEKTADEPIPLSLQRSQQRASAQ